MNHRPQSKLKKPLLLAALAFVSVETMLAQAPVQTEAASAAPAQATKSDTPAPAPGQAPSQKPPASVTTAPGASLVVKGAKAGQRPNMGMQMPGMPPPAPKAWTQFKLDPKKTILLDFTESNPNSVFAILSRASGITILKDPTFKTPLTLNSAKAVSLKSAFEMLDTVLNFSGYELHKKGDLMVVEKIPPPPPPKFTPPPPGPDMTPVAKVYRLENANAQQVARVITEVFSQSAPPAGGGGGGGFPGMPPGMVINGMPAMGGGGAPGGGAPSPVKASFDDYANSVVVFASPQIQAQVDALIKELDKSTTQALETEVFHFQHVPAEDALGAIKNMLIALAPTGRGSRQPEQGGTTNFFFRGSEDPAPAKGSQTAFAIKQTNSVVVTATKPNLESVRTLVKSMDVDASFVGTTYVVHLDNAKAADVATVLTQVFQQRRDNNSDPFGFFFFGDGTAPDKNKPISDTDEAGNLVNVRDLSGKVTITADPNTNSLIISTLPGNMKTIRDVIKQIDMPAEQVMIETIIVEATLDKTTKLGTEFNVLQGKVFNNLKTNASNQTNFGIKSAVPQPQGFSYTVSGPGYTAFLNALETDNRFKVLSTPRIFTSNNVKAEINVSQKVPYAVSQQVSSVGSTFNNYQFLDVGIVLDVTPRVTGGGQVTMDVSQTANELQGFTAFNAPIVNNRSATTTVTVDDGKTVILGGIIRENHTINDSKIPLLGDIPLIGHLFKSTSHETSQTELMVFLTPHIVHTAKDAQALREAAEKELSKGTQKGVERAIKSQTGGSGNP